MFEGVLYWASQWQKLCFIFRSFLAPSRCLIDIWRRNKVKEKGEESRSRERENRSDGVGTRKVGRRKPAKAVIFPQGCSVQYICYKLRNLVTISLNVEHIWMHVQQNLLLGELKASSRKPALEQTREGLLPFKEYTVFLDLHKKTMVTSVKSNPLLWNLSSLVHVSFQ